MFASVGLELTNQLIRKHTMHGRFLAALALAWIFTTGAAAPDKMTPIKVTEGVYMLEHSRGSGNSTIVITNDGVLVFDFAIDNADQTLEFIRKSTDKKVKYLITSHSAGDHASGAWHFREDAPVWIATKNQAHDLQMQERENFLERRNSKDPRYAAYQKGEPLTPTIAIDGPMTLYFGGLTFQITPEARAHSTGDLTVYISQKRVMLMGDLLNNEVHPGQGESAGVFFSNVDGWIKVLDSIMARSLAVETYVPGHGPVHIGRGVKDLEEQKRYFVVMRDEVAKMVQAGKTLAQIEKEFKVPQEFAHYKRPERLQQFFKLFYHQLAETGY
jgi:glyoxylase-like metal-dependent hydrolase (beta-lactamase superfamily II)